MTIELPTNGKYRQFAVWILDEEEIEYVLNEINKRDGTDLKTSDINVSYISDKFQNVLFEIVGDWDKVLKEVVDEYKGVQA